jgi:hypothetical protein
VKLGEWPVGSERERVDELKAAAVMAGESSGWRAEGRRRRLNRSARGSWVTAA